MELPPVRYCSARDGTTIAYYALGAGQPVIHIQIPGSHLHAELQLIGDSVVRSVSRFCTYIRYDHRGMGMSQRDATGFSLEAMCSDLEAVIEKEDLEPVCISTQDRYSSLVAVAYAARHPERVRRMALSYLAPRIDRAYLDRVTNLLAAFPGDVRSVTEAMLRSVREWSHSDEMSVVSAITERAIDYDTFRRLWRAIAEWDVTDELALVQAPTLLMYQELPDFSNKSAVDLASRMPRARTATVDDSNFHASIAAFFGAREAVPLPASDEPAEPAEPVALTPREVEVLRLIAAGRSNREMAGDLVLSERTVARHVANIYVKIGAHGRAEATAYALRNGLA